MASSSSSSSSSSWVMAVVVVAVVVVVQGQDKYECQVLQRCKSEQFTFVYDGLYGPQCYFIQYRTIVTWEEARQRCKKANAELASSFICPSLLHSIFNDFSFPEGTYWIGATDVKDKTWYYLNGWPVHCSFFSTPPVASSSQQCGAVVYNSESDTMYISSLNCSLPQRLSLCQMPVGST